LLPGRAGYRYAAGRAAHGAAHTKTRHPPKPDAPRGTADTAVRCAVAARAMLLGARRALGTARAVPPLRPLIREASGRSRVARECRRRPGRPPNLRPFVRPRSPVRRAANGNGRPLNRV